MENIFWIIYFYNFVGENHSVEKVTDLFFTFALPSVLHRSKTGLETSQPYWTLYFPRTSRQKHHTLFFYQDALFGCSCERQRLQSGYVVTFQNSRCIANFYQFGSAAEENWVQFWTEKIIRREKAEFRLFWNIISIRFSKNLATA